MKNMIDIVNIPAREEFTRILSVKRLFRRREKAAFPRYLSFMQMFEKTSENHAVLSDFAQAKVPGGVTMGEPIRHWSGSDPSRSLGRRPPRPFRGLR